MSIGRPFGPFIGTAEAEHFAEQVADLATYFKDSLTEDCEILGINLTESVLEGIENQVEVGEELWAKICVLKKCAEQYVNDRNIRNHSVKQMRGYAKLSVEVRREVIRYFDRFSEAILTPLEEDELRKSSVSLVE